MNELEIHVFVSLNFLFNLWFLCKSDLRIILIIINRKIHRNKHFVSQENKVIFHVFDHI